MFDMREFRTGLCYRCDPDERRGLVTSAAGSLALALAIVLLTGEAARAGCTPAAASNVTATCTGPTTNQGGGAPGTTAGTDGYGTGNETGITVNVANGAGNTVNGNRYGIYVADGTVTNNAGASITGGLYGIITNVGATNITNSGSITGSSYSGIYAQTGATVTNNAGATITGADYGIFANAGAANVTNFGTITAHSFGYGISAHTDVTVTNNSGATITAFSNAITAFNNANVTNSGSIISTSNYGIVGFNDATVINNAGASIQGLYLGIQAVFGAANVTNSGSITGTVGSGISSQTATVTNNAGASITGGQYGIIAGDGGSSVFNAGTISGGAAAIQFAGSGNTLTLAPGSVISGNVLGTGSDTFQLGGTGAATFDVSSLGPAAQYLGFGTFNKIDSSAWTLTGTSPYAGPVNVNGGTLAVNGNIASASGVTVNAGGTLGGNGTVGNTTINAGGTLAPGNSIGLLTVQGSLVFTAASSYMVEVSPANADRTNITGVATLGGATVNASFAAGTYVAKQYTILNATGGLGGSTFGSVVNTNLPSGFKSSLSYDANNAYLDLALSFIAPPTAGLSGNQQSVGNALVNFFNSNGGIPLVFGGLTAAGLSQASGETAIGSQQSTFDAMTQFMGVMTDPFVAGRGDGVSALSGAPQFAEDSDRASAYAATCKPRTNSERDACAAIYRKAPVMVDPFVQRWSAWAAGYGGSQTTDGNAALGSNTSGRSF